MESINEKRMMGADDLEKANQNNFGNQDDEYALVQRCNTLVKEIDEDIYLIYTAVKDIYQPRFPQL